MTAIRELYGRVVTMGHDQAQECSSHPQRALEVDAKSNLKDTSITIGVISCKGTELQTHVRLCRSVRMLSAAYMSVLRLRGSVVAIVVTLVRRFL